MHWHNVSTRAQILRRSPSAKLDSQTLPPAWEYRIVLRNCVVGGSEIDEFSRDHINREYLSRDYINREVSRDYINWEDLSRDHINREDLSRVCINREDLSRDSFFLKSSTKMGRAVPFIFDKKNTAYFLRKMLKNIKLQMTILGGGTSSCTVGGFTGLSRRRTLRDGCNKESGSILHTVEER